MSNERLRVLFITHSFPRSGTGPQSDALQLLADALAVQGVDVRVIAPDMRGGGAGGGGGGGGKSGAEVVSTRDSSRSDDSRVERFRVAMPRTRPARPASGEQGEVLPAAPAPAARASRRTALNFLGAGFGSAVKVRRDFNPDVVHAHWWFPSGLVGSWVSSLASLPLITSLHGFDPTSGRAGSPARPLFRHVLKRSAAITVESNAEARRLSSVLDGTSPIIAPLPIDVDVFRPAASKHGPVAMIVSPEFEREGAPLVAALRALAAHNIQVALVHDSDDDRLLRACIAAADMGNNASIVGARDREALAGTLGAAGACIVLGASEDQRALVSAAMLCGATPAFVAGHPPADILAEHFHLAMPVDGTTIEERIASLGRILAEADATRALGEAARMYALSSLAPESCAARMLGAYLRALDDAAA